MAQLDQIPGLAGLSVDENLPFPAATKHAEGMVGDVMTNVMSVSFADKILVTISQKGRLAQWLHVPLENASLGVDEATLAGEEEDSLLPSTRLTATSLLGGRSAEWEPIGHLYACQLASAIVTKNPAEKRLLVVGLGLDTPTEDRDIFFGVIDLVLRCI